MHEKEKEYLTALPNDSILKSYFSTRQTRKVSHESMIVLDKVKYSVPVKYIGLDLSIEVKNSKLYIYDNIELVNCHEISTNPLNYKKEDLKDILASDLLRGATDEKIETFIEDNKLLTNYDALL